LIGINLIGDETNVLLGNIAKSNGRYPDLSPDIGLFDEQKSARGFQEIERRRKYVC